MIGLLISEVCFLPLDQPLFSLNLLVDAQIFCKYANNDLNGMVVGTTKPSRDSENPSEGRGRGLQVASAVSKICLLL